MMIGPESLPPVAPHRLGRRLGAIGAAVTVGVLSPLVAEAAPAQASTVAPSFERFGHPNGDVTGLADDSKDHLLAVSGNFSQWTNPDGSVKPVDKLAIVDDRTGVLEHRLGSVNGYIRRVIFSNGNFYAGGSFTKVDNQPRHYLAAIRPQSGALVSNWHPSAPAEVRTLTAKDNRVYVGGYFSAVEAYSAKSGARHLWEQRLQSGGNVNVLLAYGKNLYAGGSFFTKDKPSRYGLVELSARTGRLVSKFRDRALQHPGGTCVPAHHPEWRESCKDIVLSLAKSRYGKLLIGVGGIRNKYMEEKATTGKLFKDYAIVGDVQAVADIDPDNTRAGDTAVIGFHRNSTNNHGHPLGNFTAMISDESGKFKKTHTALDALDGGGSNADGNNGGVGIELVVGNKLYVGGGFTKPDHGLEVVSLRK